MPGRARNAVAPRQSEGSERLLVSERVQRALARLLVAEGLIASRNAVELIDRFEAEQRSDRTPLQDMRVDIHGVTGKIKHVQAAIWQRHGRAEVVRAEWLRLDRRGECFLGERAVPIDPDR